MKNKTYKFLFSIILFSISYNLSYSQLGNSNMTLLANLNQHRTGSQEYSACWGYRGRLGRDYAILGCPNGTSFVDISDTTNIHEVGFVPGTVFSSTTWREMKTFSHYCY